MTIELNSCRAGAVLNASAALLLSTAAMVAGAAPIAVEYTGVISYLSSADCLTLTNGNCTAWDHTSVATSDFVDGRSVAVGSAFVGGFTYESTAPLTAMSSDGFQAIHLNSVYGAYFQSDEISLPSALLPLTSGSFSVVNDRPTSYPQFLFDSFYVSNWFSQGEWFSSLNFHLQDNTGTAFDSFDVPQTLDFSVFNANAFSLGFLRRSDGNQLQLIGDLTSVRISPVPEPSSVLLLLTGLGILLGSTYRKNKRGTRIARIG